MSTKPYLKLKDIYQQSHQLNYLYDMMHWDEATMMPEGSGKIRAQAMATFNGLKEKLLSSRKIKSLLDAAKQKQNLSPWDSANLRLMERKYLKISSIPNDLTQKFTQATSLSLQAWQKMRPQNQWKEYLPYLKNVYQLQNEIAQRHADILQLSTYDALIDDYAPGFNQTSLDSIFSDLKQKLPSLIQSIQKKQSHEPITTPLGPFSIEQQKKLGLEVMKMLHFDFNRGRLDVSHHPFCTGNRDDIRITTRYKENEFISSLLGICHETGHALYEQGLPSEWRGQLVGNVNTMAMHESQSLLIEKQICSSLPFYEYLTPHIQRIFGNQPAFTAKNIYHQVTQIRSNLIRVDSDELTYQMHIIMRYEIEKKLFNQELNIEDIADYWNKTMRDSLGLDTTHNDKDGVMQDMHWPGGNFGYFPAYTLGHLIAAQLFATFLKQQPNFFDFLKEGDIEILKTWLQDHVYSKASSLPTNDLLTEVTGETLNSTFFIDYIERKYLN